MQAGKGNLILSQLANVEFLHDLDLERTPRSSDSVCEITIRAGQTDPGSSGIDLGQRDRPLLLKLCSAAPKAVALSLVSNSSLVEGTP